MANYNYDEAGNMAAYFLITFLALVLSPITLSLPFLSSKQVSRGCQCQPCIDQRKKVERRECGSWFVPKFTAKAAFLVAGWAIFAYLCVKIAGAKLENKIYDPFEILGIRSGATEKEIKFHFKQLSRLYHPDKVKLTANMTIEWVESRFVEITKAYKSLTDATIRKNWELYGHPDGRQEVSMGIALPSWIIEGKNNVWVLGVYALVFGGALPLMVGHWWFGNRQKTKDGVNARSAAAFFKSLKEVSGMEEVIGTLGKAYLWEWPKPKRKASLEVDKTEAMIEQTLGNKWREIRRQAGLVDRGPLDNRRRALVLLYAHLLRLPLSEVSLRNEQIELLLQSPHLLSSLLTMSISRNWLVPTLSVMRLHAYLAQALTPGNDGLKLAQLPYVKADEVVDLSGNATILENFVRTLDVKGDSRIEDVKRAMQTWGRLELVEASFQVIDESIVTPSSIVFLIVKLRLSPPLINSASGRTVENDVDEIERKKQLNGVKDAEFLASRKDAEDLPEDAYSGWAHAPYWPGNRKPAWWLILADDKTKRIVVPPMKITDIPLSRSDADRNYRSYKIQFQAPQNPGVFVWKVYVVSDTFVGEEITKDVMLKIDDAMVAGANDQVGEDDISDPDEDTLAGQMALMKGGAVKKAVHEESDEESSTDDDKGSDSDSDSD